MLKRNNHRFFIEHFPLLLGILALLGVSISRIVFNDVWIDEASSLITSSLPVGEVITRALNWETQAPLYFFLLSLWMHLSPSYFFARILALILVIVFMVFIYLTVRKYEKSKLILSLFMILVATANFTIFAATTIRYYALVLLLTAMLIYIFLDKYLKEDPPPTKVRILFILLSTLAVITQYYLSILLLAFGTAVWFDKGFKRFLTYCTDMLLPILALSALANVIFTQFNTYLQLDNSSPSFLGAINFAIVKTENSIVANNYLQNIKIGRYLLRAFYILVAIAIFYSRKKLIAQTKQLALLFLISLLGLVTLYFIVDTHLINFWHTLFFFTIILLLSFFGIISLKQSWGAIILSILIVVNLSSAIFYFKPNQQFAQLTNYLESIEKPGENIYIYPNIYQDNFQFQYKGENKFLGIPGNIDYDQGFKLKSWVLKGGNQLDSFFMANYATNNKYFYILEENVSNLLNVDFKHNELDLYLNRNFTPLSDTTFQTYRLRKFRTNETLQ
ncbi:MAG: hypothetical protein K9H64_01870 [Bacteroidales bacterium]|nr:hypothetical protein [Bacteroidales bacterium]MCF8454707.1 hypothetical protein [Bacteroidales bacterium]